MYMYNVYMYVCMHVRMYICVYVCVCLYVCVCVCVCVCVLELKRLGPGAQTLNCESTASELTMLLVDVRECARAILCHVHV